MRRSFTILTGLVLAPALVVAAHAAPFGQDSKSDQSEESKREKSQARQTTREQFYAAESALFSALARAHALEKITEGQENPDFSLCRNLISTVGRDIQGVDSSSVNMGQVTHRLEKTEAMKKLRAELNEATKAADEAHNAADGHGSIGPHAKNVMAHLLKATEALVDLADEVGIEHLAAPGSDALRDALHRRADR